MKEYYSRYYDGDFYVTPRMIFDFGDAHDLSVYYYFKNQLVSRRTGEKHSRSLCFTAHDNHCFLMKSAAFAQNQIERGVKATVARRVDVETPDKTPDISTWEPWLGKLGEGRFWTTQDLGVLRQELFKRGIVPKVSLSGKQMEIKKAHDKPTTQDHYPARPR